MTHPHPHSRLYTVTDYFTWPDRLRCELINGEIYNMSPAPTLAHQDATGVLFALFREQMMTKQGGGDGGTPSSCRVFVSPVDVVLGVDTVVQPDVALVCDPAKLANGRYIDGAPDLVVEVLSPATALRDRREKRALYAAVGVTEYLLVDPVERYMEIYRLDENQAYGHPLLLGPADSFQSLYFPGITQTLSELFDWPLERPAPDPRS
ncbi:MAG: hypothetical protein FD130_307 [Halothiobacillaceae bacterium]|nr:MAG: hypothetical protein FD130_307 [Halothiobacillaceae bacterium]